MRYAKSLMTRKLVLQESHPSRLSEGKAVTPEPTLIGGQAHISWRLENPGPGFKYPTVVREICIGFNDKSSQLLWGRF
jgi:hypothetical protein